MTPKKLRKSPKVFSKHREPMRHMNPVVKEAMSVASSSDDSAAAAAVLRHLGISKIH